MTSITFEHAWVLAIGMPIAALLLLMAWSRHRRTAGFPALATTVLRGGTILIMLLLVSSPVWVDEMQPDVRRSVALLIDRSESMALTIGDQTRYQQAVTFAREKLVPALDEAELQVRAMLFDGTTTVADGPQIASARPDGTESNLAGAIRQGVVQSQPPPLAVFALTDGATTVDDENTQAIASLVGNDVAFVGIGFGDETQRRVLDVQRVAAPAVVSPNEDFTVSAHLRAFGLSGMPEFELMLLRDGQYVSSKQVAATSESRIWKETFPVMESTEGFHKYTVQLVPPASPSITCTTTSASTSVRIVDDRELRVLFVQGALTWDYKFIRLALRGDPTIRVSGLSRTASQSTFLQSVENDLELSGGFPATIEELAKFRVVVLSNLRPKDLAPAQQELLAEFCGQLGGGVLMMGGPRSFNVSWKASRLEQLLPVRFAGTSTTSSGPAAFRLKPTDRALRHPVFQIDEPDRNRIAWSRLPRFAHFATVDSIKRGAQVWLEHEHWGQERQPALMAVQRYGAGISSVICVQNFWRWRLAKDSKSEQFDRFWRQLLRYLGEGGRDSVAITFPDQMMQPNKDIDVLLSTRAGPPPGEGENRYVFRVVDEMKRVIVRQVIELDPGNTVKLEFRCPDEGVFAVETLDVNGAVRAQRSIQIRKRSGELLSTSRNMDNLRQWANLSGGLAVEYEQCGDVRDVLSEILSPPNSPKRSRTDAVPAGINGWMFSLLLVCICGEWLLRRRWHMT